MIYSFMFPRDPGDDTPGPRDGDTALLPLAEGPCPSCAAFLDQLDGAAEHASQHVNLAVVAKAPLPRVLAFARERGWRRLRLLSSAANTYNADYFAETPDGTQRPMLTVFHRRAHGIRHFWSSELFYAPPDPGQDPRHVGTLEPLWNLFDLTPEGRPIGLGLSSSATNERRAIRGPDVTDPASLEASSISEVGPTFHRGLRCREIGTTCELSLGLASDHRGRFIRALSSGDVWGTASEGFPTPQTHRRCAISG